jgi:hypothetical protein
MPATLSACFRIEMQVGGGSDYRYRARIDREHVADAIAEAIRTIKYGNFKNTVMEADRHDAYFEVWEDMYAYQRQERR